MNREDIILMATAAGLYVDDTPAWDGILSCLERFAALVAAAEREECAKVCEGIAEKKESDGTWLWEARNCATAIRAREVK